MTHSLVNSHQKCSVMVNDGSGVLIQPMTPAYAYVLTAKHCIQKIGEDINNLQEKEAISITCFEETNLEVLEIVFDRNIDIAILIVKPQLELNLSVNNKSLKVNDLVRLSGYPQDRRGFDQKYSSFIFKFQEQRNKEVIFLPDAAVSQSNIVGFSGGGLFTINEYNEETLLCAVETKMDGDTSLEFHGQISAVSISSYSKLIEENTYLNEPLAPLLPLHLSSFEHLLDLIFDVVRSWIDDRRLDLVKACLREVASTNVIEVNITPFEILSKFKNLLKVYNRPDDELTSKGMWSSFLELLVVSILIDKPIEVNLAYIDNMLKSRRLTYIGETGGWMEYLNEILQSDLDALNKNAIIIASTLASPRKTSLSSEELKKVWASRDISKPLTETRSIIRVNKQISEIHSVVDLSALHADCIECKETEYVGCTDVSDYQRSVLESKLAQEYGIFLDIKEVVDEN
tara:strand:+ start:2207 stop:3580 length:1374 start_codon:yes stop_codon:yes gene_type:complete